jgi:hypothetical protein
VIVAIDQDSGIPVNALRIGQEVIQQILSQRDPETRQEMPQETPEEMDQDIPEEMDQDMPREMNQNMGQDMNEREGANNRTLDTNNN